MDRRELFLPYPDSIRDAPVTTTIRSTVLIISINGLRERGHLDAYKKLMPTSSLAKLEEAVVGVWLPISIAQEHYGACDRLNLPPDEQVKLGGLALEKLQSSLMGTIAKTIGGSGIVNMWDAVGRFNLFFARNFQGGGGRVWKVGPKDADIEISGMTIAHWPYVRCAYRGLLARGARFFAPNSLTTELPKLCGRASLGYRLSWV